MVASQPLKMSGPAYVHSRIGASKQQDFQMAPSKRAFLDAERNLAILHFDPAGL
jgi:hypothetical protein